MKKLFLAAFVSLSVLSVSAQTDSTAQAAPTKKKDWSKVSLGNRANDHFMLQIGYDGWAAKPDTIRTKGFPRSLNVYFMLDFPFKTDPRFSVGLGVGIGSNNMYFDKVEPKVAGTGSKLEFRDVSDTTHFKKFKLSTTYAEVPLELRFALDPEHPNKTFKFAVGAKVGLLINAHTRGKILQNSAGNTLNNYVAKENSKKYFNGTRLSVTGRISRGVFGVFGSYQVNNFIKDGLGPNIRPYSIGLVISGL